MKVTIGLLVLLATGILSGCRDAEEKSAAPVNVPSTENSTGWLKQLYAKAIDTSVANPENLRIIFFKQLNDSISYCLFEINDELCSTTFLATQVGRMNRQISQVEENCAGEYSNPVHTYSTYSFDSTSNTVKTTEITETADKEYLLVDGEEKKFREGYDMQNAKTKTDSIVLFRIIQKNGKILEKQRTD